MHTQTIRRLGTSAALIALFLANSIQAHSSLSQKKPATPAEKGRLIFVNNCAVCHGANALGDEGPSLHALKMTQSEIIATVSKGFEGQMPAFKKKLKAAELKQLATYLKTLKK